MSEFLYELAVVVASQFPGQGALLTANSNQKLTIVIALS
jgi:hypothetical protein